MSQDPFTTPPPQPVTGWSSTKPPEQPIAPPKLDLNATLRCVAELKSAGQFAQAADLLEQLFQADKPHPVVAFRLLATLLDLQQFDRLLKHVAAQPFNSRDFALAQHLHGVDTNSRPTLVHTPQPADLSLAYVTMVKNERDIIGANLAWHYGLGVRRFFIIDNQSTDSTRQKIDWFAQSFKDATVMVLHDPVVAHLQRQKVTGGLRYVCSLWPEVSWVLLVDADEFICTEQPLTPMLANLDPQVDALALPKSQYVLRPDSPDDPDSTLPFYRRMPHRLPLSQQSPKIIIRARNDWVVAQGNHRIDETLLYTQRRYASLPGLTMREFSLRSYDHFKQKVITGGTAIEQALAQGAQRIGGDHWTAGLNLYREKGDVGLRQAFNAKLAENAHQSFEDPLPIDAALSALGVEFVESQNQQQRPSWVSSAGRVLGKFFQTLR